MESDSIICNSAVYHVRFDFDDANQDTAHGPEGADYVLEANGIGLTRLGEEAAGIDGVRQQLKRGQG